jgi:ribonucleoside-triphosphate reductase
VVGGEISLRPNQMCNLTEINVSNLESQDDFNKRAIAAAFIGTLQASYTDFHYLRPIWKKNTEKDALLGVSMTGIASMQVFKYDIEEAVSFVQSTNEEVAKMIGINSSARLTTVKPAGTTSLTLGTSSGIHAWHNDYYIRRLRVGKNEAIYNYLKIYHPELVEDEIFRPNETAVISIPQKAPDGAVTRHETPISLLERIKTVFTKWILPGHNDGSNTHNVSATVSIKPNEWHTVGEWMWENRNYYNGISVLPYDNGSYQQAPFEDISEEQYNELVKSLDSIDLTKIVELTDETNLSGELACAGGACEII